MRRLLGGLAAALVALLLILFAVSNRAPAELKLEPLPFVLALPLYAMLLGTLVVGFLAGGIIAFFAGAKTRRRARRAEAEAARLERELAAARSQLAVRAEGEARLARSAPGLTRGLPAPSILPPHSLPKAS
jgi:putative membrane protein